MRYGLTGRMVVASGLLAVIVGGAFAFVLVTISELNGTTDLRRQTREELVAADALEKDIVDLETGLRGFVITRDESFLQPSNDARAALPGVARRLERLAADEPVQLARVRRIVGAMNAYIQDYALPLVDAVRRNDPSVRSVAGTLAAKQRVDALREGIGSFRVAERARLSARDADVDQAARRARVAGVVGVAGSILLILGFASYLTRVIVRPLRRAALMADRLAGGHLNARMRDTDVAEIGALERSFNVMAGSLETSRDELASLVAEQAALRQVATLVAREASQAEVFTSIAEEIGKLLGTEEIRMLRYEDDRRAVVVASWGQADELLPIGSRLRLEDESTTARVFRTRQPVRIADFAEASGAVDEQARSPVLRCVVATPILVEGQLWGVMTAGTTDEEPLPPETESRLVQFTELMATAIANTESHARAERLTAEQAALRRVATLVANEASPAEVFARVAEEVAEGLGDVDAALMRNEGDGTAGVVAVRAARASASLTVGTRLPLDGDNVVALTVREGRPRRIEQYAKATGTIAERARALGVRAAVGCPVVVGERTWGALAVATYEEDPPPPDTEARLAQFADLVATAIANDEARAEVRRLAEEQAALRRVATLIAMEAPPAEVFAKVAEEVGNALGGVDSTVARNEGDGTIRILAACAGGTSATARAGVRLAVDGTSVVARVLAEGRPFRVGDSSVTTGTSAEQGREAPMRSAAACPIVVRGRTWGVVAVASREGAPIPPGGETHMAQFAELVATAIANADARAEVERLAAEQAAMRRVAMLVAQGAAPTAVLDAVAAEMEAVLGADGVTLSRYEPGDEVTIVAHRGSDAWLAPPGTRVRHEGENVTTMVRRTERPVRMENHVGADGAFAELVEGLGERTSVGAPIAVDGRLWGVAIAHWRGEESPQADTEQRMAQFAQLLDTAIANADSRDQLTASRARVLTAGDEARRRLVRDLHDGAQQRLVHTVVTLKLAQQALREHSGRAEPLIAEALAHAQQGNTELRELAHGILPAALAHGGLRAGVGAVVSRLDLPVDVDVAATRFAREIEASAYFVVAEALTNVVKHAGAQHAEVKAFVEDGTLHVEVADDGTGGADPDGQGLVGMADRVAALGGRLRIESPAGGGTVLTATLPLTSR